jgi:hypothetical protein
MNHVRLIGIAESVRDFEPRSITFMDFRVQRQRPSVHSKAFGIQAPRIQNHASATKRKVACKQETEKNLRASSMEPNDFFSSSLSRW